jgi:hypothetical protein
MRIPLDCPIQRPGDTRWLTTGRKEVTPIAHRSPVAKVIEVSYFAQKHGIGPAEGLIKRNGNDRTKLNAAAEKLKK